MNKDKWVAVTGKELGFVALTFLEQSISDIANSMR